MNENRMVVSSDLHIGGIVRYLIGISHRLLRQRRHDEAAWQRQKFTDVKFPEIIGI